MTLEPVSSLFSTPYTKTPSPPFRFTLRGLLAFMAMAGLVVGFLADHRRLIQREMTIVRLEAELARMKNDDVRLENGALRSDVKDLRDEIQRLGYVIRMGKGRIEFDAPFPDDP